ncbi:MAG: DUF1343 domain-containing protein [Saprospiraceae bacterium]|nr:DUF1343 domain-containing protein [Saprospiraceae bacterium]
MSAFGALTQKQLPSAYPFLLGVEAAIASGTLLDYYRIGMVTNDAATTNTEVLSRKLLLEQRVSIIRLFAPEHGIAISGADGVAQADTTDPVTGLPVISLYRDDPAPQDQHLLDLDLVIFDVPDVGARFYTYLWTLSYVMQACERLSIPIMIMDRPNPISALIADCEGPFLDEINCGSFLGRWNIPLKHSCTLGEMASYFKYLKMPDLNLTIFTMEGYSRHLRAGMHYPFQPTSPALFRWQGLVLYPGTCLLEGLNLNEGRGTSTPFECFGAPWLDSALFIQSFPIDAFPYLSLKAITYVPHDSFYKNELCQGIELQLHTPEVRDAVSLGMTIISTLCKTQGKMLHQRAYKTMVNPEGGQHLDRLTGIFHVYELFQRGLTPPIDIAAEWRNIIQPFLLYPNPTTA